MNKGGVYKAAGKTLLNVGKAGMKTALPEALEEGAQFATNNAAKYYMSERAKNPEAVSTFNDFMSAVLFGAEETIGTKEGRLNMVSGALIGGMMITPTKNKDGKTKIGINSVKEFRELQKNKTESQAQASKMNADKAQLQKILDTKIGSDLKELRGLLNPEDGNINTEKIKAKRDSIITNISAMQDELTAIQMGDVYSAKTFKDQGLANLAVSFIEGGHLEDFKQLIRDGADFSAEDLRNVLKEDITDADGKVLETIGEEKTKSDAEVVQAHKDRINKTLEHLDKIGKIYEKVNEITQGKLNTSSNNDIVNMMFNYDRHI
jgi:hypothetical protein